jgi:ABC-type lipoprotein release transport system permease subunit
LAVTIRANRKKPPHESAMPSGSSSQRGVAVWTAALPGIALSAAGLVLGSVLAIFAARALRSMLWGVSSNDPVTFAGVGLCLLLVAAAASFLPALRVARIRPSDALRAE